MAKKQTKKNVPAIVAPPTRGPGRPHELTPETHEAIVKAVRGGNYITTSAEMSGISKATLFAWMQRGARGEHPFAELFDAVKKARAEAKAAALGTILRAAAGSATQPPQWQAAAWFLERTSPDEFGKRVRVLTNDEVDTVSASKREEERVDLGQLSAEELRTLQHLRAKARVVRVISGDGKDEDDA